MGINLLAPATQRTRVWAYDNLWRLQSEALGAGQANGNGSVTYSLDSVGNRLSRSSSIPGLATQSFSYNVNDRLAGDTYDANGNTKTAGAQSSPTVGPAGVSPAPVLGADNYNSSNQLTTRNAPNGDSVQLIHDGDGNKVRQITTRGGFTTTTTYLVDDMNPTGYAQVLEEKVNGSLTKVYTFGHDLISLDQYTAGNWNLSYYGYDGHGSVRFLSNALGQVTDTYDYDAFGTLLVANGATANSYLYCGESYDADLGLYNLRARLMNPLTGRFWTADDYEGGQSDPASLHKYMYAGGDGVNLTDASGNFSLGEVMINAGIGAIIGSLAAVNVASYLNPSISEEELWTAAASGARTGALAGVGFGVRAASSFIQAIRIVAGAGLTLINAHQAITAENPREAKVYAALAILGVWGVWSSTKPIIGSSANPGYPISRGALNSDLMSRGFRFVRTSPKGYSTYKHADGRVVTIKPTGEVIPTKPALSQEGKKYSERTDYDFQRLPDQSHSTNHFVEPLKTNTPSLAPTSITPNYDEDDDF